MNENKKVIIKNHDDLIALLEYDNQELSKILKELNQKELEMLLDELSSNRLDEIMNELTIEDTIEIVKLVKHDLKLRIIKEDDIFKLIENKNYHLLKPIFQDINPIDIANILNELNGIELLKVFRILPKDSASEAFVEMDNMKREELLENLTNKEVSNMLDDIFLDDMVDIIEEMPANVVKRMLSLSDNETRKSINWLLQYSEDSAGSIMTLEYIKLKSYMNVKDAIDTIRYKALDKETIYTCYVVDDKNKLIGVVTAKDLLIHKDDELIKDFMHKHIIFSRTSDDKEEVAQKISKYGFLAMPIVDNEDRLVGIVTVDDAIEVLEEETQEDFSKMNAMLPTDKEYLDMSVFEIWRKRIPWLMVLLVSATFTGLIITKFEGALQVISPLLFACVPMMMDTGGNAGSQASVTIIRGISLNQINIKDYAKIIWKEFRASLLLGLTLGSLCFIKLLLIDRLILQQNYTIPICLVVSLALLITVVIAKLVGATLPLLAKLVKLDPAVVASPFITTIVDAVALMLYCILAISLL